MLLPADRKSQCDTDSTQQLICNSSLPMKIVVDLALGNTCQNRECPSRYLLIVPSAVRQVSGKHKFKGIITLFFIILSAVDVFIFIFRFFSFSE